MREKNNTETSTWISNTDLMSGLLIIFLFISILMTQQYDDVLNKSDKVKEELKTHLTETFTEEEKHVFFTKDETKGDNQDPLAEGHMHFADNGATFEVNQAVLTPEFKKKLDIVLPKYFKAISECDPKTIKEIRIEGYTSSEWYDSSIPPNVAYYYNMELSQKRTLAILEYAFSMPSLVPYHDLMKEKLTANGLSSRNPIAKKDENGNILCDENGKEIEDKEKSRRIEFRVVTNDQKIIEDLKDVKNTTIND